MLGLAVALFLVLFVAWGAFLGRSCDPNASGPAPQCPGGYSCKGGRCVVAK